MKKVRDHYFTKAKREGFAARAAYKLEAVDGRRKLLRPGMRVLDLGCAPGSWLQYAGGRVGPSGQVLGVDLQALPAQVAAGLPAWVTARQGDVFALEAASLPAGFLPCDVLLSDMAPATSGIKSADAARSTALVRRVLALTPALLRPGGALLAKVFQGGEMAALRGEFRDMFEQVSVEKPPASRSESVEVFLLGQGWRG